MVDVKPTKTDASFYAELLDLADTAVNDVTTEWISPLTDVVPTGVLVSRTMVAPLTSLSFGWQVKYGESDDVYDLTEPDGTAWLLTLTTDGNAFMPFISGNNIQSPTSPLHGISALRAIVGANDAGGVGSVLKLAVVGREAVWMR